jgi:hypothetical protein
MESRNGGRKLRACLDLESVLFLLLLAMAYSTLYTIIIFLFPYVHPALSYIHTYENPFLAGQLSLKRSIYQPNLKRCDDLNLFHFLIIAPR